MRIASAKLDTIWSLPKWSNVDLSMHIASLLDLVLLASNCFEWLLNGLTQLGNVRGKFVLTILTFSNDSARECSWQLSMDFKDQNFLK